MCYSAKGDTGATGATGDTGATGATGRTAFGSYISSSVVIVNEQTFIDLAINATILNVVEDNTIAAYIVYVIADARSDLTGAITLPVNLSHHLIAVLQSKWIDLGIDNRQLYIHITMTCIHVTLRYPNGFYLKSLIHSHALHRATI
jgi:hypothetical protein